jgi:MerR family transcriptional regulator, redox-sensitive transcriptional activator SoxR
MRIGEVARRAGIPASRLRYYEQLGLLPEPDRVSGRRRYDASVLARLAAIAAAQRGGLSLADIRELVADDATPLSARLHEIGSRRLPQVEADIARAQRARAWLEAATRCDCRRLDDCALFAAA